MTKSQITKVAVIMGSQSDESVMSACLKALDHFNIPYEFHVMSAHRDPDAVIAFAENAEANGFQVIIAGAGMAAHLPGVIASRTLLPVIGVPLSGSALNGLDALYSIVQMPGGIPVATVAIGKAGAKNAAILAAEILALSDPELKKQLVDFRKAGSKL
ncbi:5-(carboxyamino)imidazole ribonucleotide mutase [candidate division KSB1 bacterium]|nr:5-(carboxyamino)imidazole ribonucleotide mutase [candidate division KSB1 bacterium]